MKLSLVSAVLVAGLGLSAASFAAATPDGTITINGALTATTCTINGNGSGSKDFTVTLPTVSTALLTGAGSSTGVTGFTIALTACTADVPVHTFFNYGANVQPDGALKNATGTAANVEVQLLNKNLALLDLTKADGVQGDVSTAISGGAATMQYAAQYYSPLGGAGAGSVATSVTYNISYQ